VLDNIKKIEKIFNPNSGYLLSVGLGFKIQGIVGA